MRILNIFLLFLTMFILTSLTGCSPSHIEVKPSTDSLGEFEHSATGKVHLLPTQKNTILVVESDKEPGYTDLSPYLTSTYTTNDDVVDTIHQTSLSALRDAGYAVSTGQDAPADTELSLAITLRRLVATFRLGRLTPLMVEEALEGDFDKKKNSVFSEIFGNLPTGLVVTKVAFTNPKTKDTVTTYVSGADNTIGLGTANYSVETAVRKALVKYKLNLVRAIQKMQQGQLESRD